MNPFQLTALPLVGFLFIRSILRLAKGNQSRRVTFVGAVIWLTAGTAILLPEKTHEIAWILGIGRGADLILYLLAICFLLSVFYIYNRFQKLDSNITQIIRHIAIEEGLRNSQQIIDKINKKLKHNND